MFSLSEFQILVWASYFSLFHSIYISCFAYPATYSVDTVVLFWDQIGGRVISTTDLRQASMTVAKSFLACENMSGLI